MKTVDLITLKKERTEFVRAKIHTSKNAADFARQFYFDDLEIYESFFLILLDRKNETHGYVKISQGGIAGTVVDIKLIAKYAIESLSSGVVLVHNHPSGNLKASIEDEKITSRVINALNIFDIKVFDHIILTASAYYSFQDEGLL